MSRQYFGLPYRLCTKTAADLVHRVPERARHSVTYPATIDAEKAIAMSNPNHNTRSDSRHDKNSSSNLLKSPSNILFNGFLRKILFFLTFFLTFFLLKAKMQKAPENRGFGKVALQPWQA